MTVPPKGSMVWKEDRSWWDFSDRGIVLTEKAPPEAIESFKLWKEWRKAESERHMRTGILA